MAIDNFIPEVWAAGVTQAFIANQVVIPTLNNAFTGDIVAGNKVHIINATTPTIADYSATRTITAEALADTEVLLEIDQEKAFSVNVDDVDRVQASSEFAPWVDSAGRALAEDAEDYLLNTVMLVGAQNANPTDIVVDSADDALTAVRTMRTLMGKAKVPAAGRYLVVSPDFADFLIQGLDDVSVAGQDSELRNGVIGRLYGFTVLESPLLDYDGNTNGAIAYHESMVAFVNQVQSLESLRNPTKFADIVRGLNVYGGKVLKNEAVYRYYTG
jgi:hypothetical protein